MDLNYKNEGYKKPSDLDSWEKAYWFMRVLIDSNRYGNFSGKAKKITSLYNNLLAGYTKVMQQDEDELTKKKILDSILVQSIFDGVDEKSKTHPKMEELYFRLQDFLITPKDYFTLAVTAGELLLPTSEAVRKVPSAEVTDFAKKFAKAVLDVKGTAGLSTIVRDWDLLTEDFAINKERDLIVELFGNIREKFGSQVISQGGKIDEKGMDIVLTAISQEYERRVGQKRKSRAGKDFESSVDYIFNYFGIKTYGQPDHFSTSMELDNWLKCKDGWYLGVSMKRTFRERWKQTLTTEIGFYDRSKIKYVLHLVNNDSDLSDAKVSEMGGYRHLFFLGDNSEALKRLSKHVALSKYVFPMSSLIDVVKNLMNNGTLE